MQASYAVAAGIDFIQIRESDLAADALSAIVADVLEVARGSRTRILVNDRVDVALACGAHGVHLRADSAAPQQVRRIVPPGFVVGQSVHTVTEAAVAADDVDYLIAGTIWPTSSKPQGHPLLGLDGLTAIVKAARVPVLAIGGVDIERLPAILAAGASGIAGIEIFLSRIEQSGHCRAGSLDAISAVRARITARR
jgi:thiamine-phosphate pyrophosphorylase